MTRGILAAAVPWICWLVTSNHQKNGWSCSFSHSTTRISISSSSTPISSSSPSSSSSLTSSTAALPDLVILQVCMSPGCVADGSQITLDQLQALAPPHVRVEAGVCVSQCGYGPVVLQQQDEQQQQPAGANKQQQEKESMDCAAAAVAAGGAGAGAGAGTNIIRHKRVAGAKVIELLQQLVQQQQVVYNSNSYKLSPELLQGYQFVERADEAFIQKDYTVAINLYQKGIEIAFHPAMSLVQYREQIQPPPIFSSTQTIQPIGLEWLIRARRNIAFCIIQLNGNLVDAELHAQASCNLSRNTSAESFRILALIYEKQENVINEIQALQTYFVLMNHLYPQQQQQQQQSLSSNNQISTSNADKTTTTATRLRIMSRIEENHMRLLGFRLNKLLKQQQ